MAADPADRPRYELGDLYPGCQIWTPFHRWETIRRIEETTSVGRYVVTDKCADGHGWKFPRWRTFEAIIPRGEQYTAVPEVRLVDATHIRTPRMLLVPTAAHVEIPNFIHCIGEAVRLGPGRGWEVYDTTAAGELDGIPRPDKATARTVLRAAGRAYAKGLGVRYCEQAGAHHHPKEA
jgi:hypothetical protein